MDGAQKGLIKIWERDSVPMGQRSRPYHELKSFVHISIITLLQISNTLYTEIKKNISLNTSDFENILNKKYAYNSYHVEK